ncbi:MAG: hypothetical protein K6G22_07585 [Lachnospiraceae bacterium]|nr:hypothetical protein [Lachnospiraceae bacterium]
MIGRSKVTRLVHKDIQKLNLFELMDKLHEQNSLLLDQHESLSGLGNMMLHVKYCNINETPEERAIAEEQISDHVLDSIADIVERLDIISNNIDIITLCTQHCEKVGDLNG